MNTLTSRPREKLKSKYICVSQNATFTHPIYKHIYDARVRTSVTEIVTHVMAPVPHTEKAASF